jgi:hypothetical protein
MAVLCCLPASEVLLTPFLLADSTLPLLVVALPGEGAPVKSGSTWTAAGSSSLTGAVSAMKESMIRVTSWSIIPASLCSSGLIASAVTAAASAAKAALAAASL